MSAATPRTARGAAFAGRAAEGPIEAEVVVIGGGIAGMAAALAARRHGRTAAIVRRGWGGTALSSGLFELAPDPLEGPALPLGERRPVQGCVEALARSRPGHPWALLASDGASWKAALQAATAESGGRIRFVDPDRENRCLLTPLGTLKASAGGLDSIPDGDLLQGGRVGVVGLGLHPAWDAALLAAALDEGARQAGLQVRAMPVVCDWLRPDDHALPPHQLAARLEVDPHGFGEAVRRALPAGIDRLLLPAILGLGDPGPILRTLEEVCGLPCAELPAAGTAPLPGLRLQRLLEERAVAAGVTLWQGEASAPDGSPGSLQVAAPGGHGAWPVRAGAVVLATGRFLGGGIVHAGAVREAIFDLPVAPGNTVASSPQAPTAAALLAPQAAFSAGVQVDEQLRPLDAEGRPRDERLFACGEVIGGDDPARDGTGAGLAWCTGWLAGIRAAGGA